MPRLAFLLKYVRQVAEAKIIGPTRAASFEALVYTRYEAIFSLFSRFYAVRCSPKTLLQFVFLSL